MVTFYIVCNESLLLGDQAAPSELHRLDPPTRARVLMALLGLVLVGVALIACIMIGGRWVRQLARHAPRSSTVWTSSTGVAPTQPSANGVETPTGETLAGKDLTDETLTD